MSYHIAEDGTVWVDTTFVSNSQHAWPGAELVHLGGGEFALNTMEGNVEYFRADGQKDWPGREGRAHKAVDNRKGTTIAALLKLVDAYELAQGAKDSAPATVKS